MNLPARAFFSATLWAGLLALSPAQVVIGNRIILNGGNLVLGVEDGAELAKTEPDPTGAQVLDFTSGQRLHGTLEALDMARGQMIWRRPDASAPLSIPLAQINRWTFESKPGAEARPAATVKFTGGDWLIADVTAIQGEKVELRLADGSPLTTERVHLEWIYFSKTTAAETYDGPTSLSGWTSAGGWSYREGALYASNPTPVSRYFQALPDQVEYRLTVDQGETSSAFNLSLHARNTPTRGLSRGTTQIMLRANTLHLTASIDGHFKSVQVDLTKLAGDSLWRGKGPLFFRVFEDFTGGRLLVFINGRKAAEWTIDKGEAGKNGGAFQFQPTSWSGGKEQSLSKIQVRPWDGREPTEEAEPAGDRVSLTSGEEQTGHIVSWDGQALKLQTERGSRNVPGDQIRLLHFRRPENPPEEDPPAVRVRLAGRGEFDATKLDWRDGKFQLQTNFGGALALAPAALTELEFSRPTVASRTAEDRLVFQNGDRLSGTLETATEGGALRWRQDPAGPSVDFSATHLAGLQFATRLPGLPGPVAARCRNGDWITGRLLRLDRQELALETAAGPLTIPRPMVKALYFGHDAAPALSDGAADHEAWERGLPLNAGNSLTSSTSSSRPIATAGASPWSYFAGTFSLAQPGSPGLAQARSGGLQLGRMFETLPERVEVSFTITTERPPVYFNAQVFTEPNNAGYMLHLSTIGVSVYDMNPRRMQGGVGPQQFPFGPDARPNARTRQVQLLADRPSGRLTILVDSAVVARIHPKASDGPRKLGRGILLSPASNISCTFSNLWVGPWNGRVPGHAPFLESAPEMVALANGDEVPGSVETVTPDRVKMTSEVGPLDLPLERLTMIDFGGAPVARTPGTRLQLAGQGALTVHTWRIENDSLICRSEIAGELTLPLTAVQEMILATPASPTETN